LENRDAKLGDAYQQVETLRQEASEKASQISQMKSTLSSSKSELDKITHEKVQIEHQVTNLRAKLADKESQLSQQMAMNQKLASQYQVLASTSTVPIVAPAVPSAPEEPVASHVKKSVSTDSLASLSSPLARSKLLTGTSAASMEMYNATLFQKDGEISQLQATIEILTSQKSAVFIDYVTLFVPLCT
jgi:DNA repair exonuclease SbcCD ATPase subunit